MNLSRLFQGILCATLLFSGIHVRAAVPAAPEYVKVAWIENRTEFLVRWHAVADATGYNIYRQDTNTSAWVQVATNLIFNPWNVLSFRDASAWDAGPATYAVAAVNADGESPFASALVAPGPGLGAVFTTQEEWWPRGYTFIDPGFMGDRPEGTDGMVELGLDETNFTHGAWNTNIHQLQSLHITNLSPGLVFQVRMTMVDSNGIGITVLYPPWGKYTLPLLPIDVWEVTVNQIAIGDYTWVAVGQVYTPPAHGVVVPGSYYQNWTCTPEPDFTGIDTFQILDNPDGPPVTITLNVQNINDPPIAHEFTVYVPEDTQSVFTPPVTDIDSSFYVIMVTTPPVYGWALGWQTTSLYYDPPVNFVGTDEFMYIAADYEWSLPARVIVIVTNVNDAPVTEHQSFSTQEDTPVTFTLSATDVDGDPLTVLITQPPLNGTVTNTGLTVTYTPNPNFHGGDGFEFRISDGQTTSDWRYADIFVEPVNDVPAANSQSVSTPYNTAVNIVLTGSDVEGSALAFTTLSSPANGTLTGTGANRTFTPNIGWSGSASFTFKVNDGELDSAPATIIITVAGPGTVPAAPSALTATAVSQTQINLAWSDNSANEDGFKIERATSSSGPWAQIATVGPNVQTYSSTGLTKNKRYYYRVRAYNVLGDSPYSNTANARTLN